MIRSTKPPPRLPVFSWDSTTLRRQLPPIFEAGENRIAAFASSGRAAIFLGLEALSVGPGDEVLVPTYHCPTMIAPVVQVGAVPIFYPVTASGSPHIEWLSKTDTRRVKVLLAAHFFGLPQAMGSIKEFCVQRGIALIEDCAHACFGAHGATPVGTVGDLSIVSLPKFFPVPEGGCLIGPPALMQRVRITAPSKWAEVRAIVDTLEVGAEHGSLGLLGSSLNKLVALKRRIRGTDRPQASDPGAIRVDAVESWLDVNLLRRGSTAMTQWTTAHTDQVRLVNRRRANYALWTRSLGGLADAEVLFPQLPDAAVPYVFPLRVRNPEAKYRALRESGVPVFRWDVAWPGVPQLPGDEGRVWLTEVFQLGCHQDMSEADILRLLPLVQNSLRR